MADQSRLVTELPVKTAVNGPNDAIIFIYNRGLSTAQTAVLTIPNLFANTANLTILVANLQVNILTSTAPANSESWTIRQGTIVVDANNIYIATANNFIKKAALSSF